MTEIVQVQDIICKISQIISAEQDGVLDSEQVKIACKSLIDVINRAQMGDCIDNDLYSYLDDADIRSKDVEYARWQVDLAARVVRLVK